MKSLIINADDFGYSTVFNDAILALAKKGFISSTTVMVNWVTGEQASQVKQLVELTESHNLSVGLHFEFTDGELERQFEKFVSIFGFKPSHIDLHKSMHLEAAYPTIVEFCRKHQLPCRNEGVPTDGVVKTHNAVLSGTAMSLDELKTTIRNFKDGESYEILLHPGMYDPNCKSSLNKDRELDIKKIEGLQALLKENNVQLISYRDLADV